MVFILFFPPPPAAGEIRRLFLSFLLLRNNLRVCRKLHTWLEIESQYLLGVQEFASTARVAGRPKIRETPQEFQADGGRIMNRDSTAGDSLPIFIRLFFP